MRKHLKEIHSLAMLKMEKNFIAHLEKKYPQQPYRRFTSRYLLGRIKEETSELRIALDKNDLRSAILEVADISNLCDYLFERLCELEIIRGETRIPELGELFK